MSGGLGRVGEGWVWILQKWCERWRRGWVISVFWDGWVCMRGRCDEEVSGLCAVY
jgi:hypothetical protein